MFSAGTPGRGRLTSDPTARTDAEHPSAAFRLAIPRGGNSETADFVDIVTFDALAKTVADHLTKGRRVAVPSPPKLKFRCGTLCAPQIG